MEILSNIELLVGGVVLSSFLQWIAIIVLFFKKSKTTTVCGPPGPVGPMGIAGPRGEVGPKGEKGNPGVCLCQIPKPSSSRNIPNDMQTGFNPPLEAMKMIPAKTIKTIKRKRNDR